MTWDAYEIRARIIPTIMIFLPIGIALFFIIMTLSDTLIEALLEAGAFLSMLVYGLSFVPRYFGSKIEQDLWLRWGGAPSTRIMRWRDETINDDSKKQLHAAVEQRCDIKLSSKEEESASPKKADDQIKQAFKHVKGIVRNEDPNGLWSVHNAEYGSYRNLLGSRRIWLVISILSTAILGILWYNNNSQVLLLGTSVDLLIIIISIICGWYFLPEITKKAADRYAESVWTTFLLKTKNGAASGRLGMTSQPTATQ